MHNKKLYNEVRRMIDLFENNENKSKLLKNSLDNKVKSKKKLTESFDDIDFSDLFDEKREEEEDKKIESLNSSLSPSDDISLLSKLALATGSMNKLQAAMFDLQSKDFLKLSDLKSDRVMPDEEKGAVYSKGKKDLYPGQSVAEFRDMLSKGRHILKVGNQSENLDSENVGKVFKWLGGTKGKKSLHNIGFGSDGKLSKKGNAELNFLARIVSGQPKDETEQKILDTFGNAAKANAFAILFDFYKVASVNVISPLLNALTKDKAKVDEWIVEGVVKAINDLAGIRDKGKKKGFEHEATSYNPNKNVGPWIIQIAKNYAKNEMKEKFQYIPDEGSAYNFFKGLLDREGVISVLSRKEPSHTHYADEVEQVGKKWLYKYSKIEKAIDDLKASQDVKNHHLKSYNLETSKYKDLFSSAQKNIDTVPHEDAKDFAADDVALGVDKVSELGIRNILSKVVDFMTLDNTKYGVKRGTHDPTFLTGDDKKEIKSGKDESLIRKRKELARENAINFMYNHLLSVVGNTEYGTDTGKTGNINPDVMDFWIKGQRKAILAKLIEIEKKNNPNISKEEVEKRAKELGLLTKGAETKMTQAFRNGLRDYFSENKGDLSKVMNLISSTPPEGYEVETDIETIFEQKVRAKIRKIIREKFVIKEDYENDDINTDVDNALNVFGNKFANYTTYDKSKLNKEIKNILNGEGSKWNFENSSEGQHSYITTMLASLYNSLNNSEQENVFKYMFKSYFPYNQNSKFLSLMSQNRTGNRDVEREKIWDAIMTPESNNKMLLTNALEMYEPKGSFFHFFNRRILNKVADLTKKYDKFIDKGENKWKQNVYIDAPAKDSDSGSAAFELESEPAVDDRRENAKHILSYVLSVLGDKLSKSQRNLLIAIKNMGDDAFSPEGELVYGLVANRTGLSDSNVGSTMSSVKKMAKELREKGEV